MEIPRTATRRGRQFSRGRGLTLLAAAALLVVGGAVAAGSGLVRLPSLVPPEPEPSLAAVATPASESPAPTALTSPAPTDASTPVAGPGGVWIPTGPMGTPRSGYTAVRLLDGRVLVAGGSAVTSRPDLRRAVRPGHRDLVSHREHAQAPCRVPSHAAARRQGTRGRRHQGELRRRTVRPGQRDLVRYGEPRRRRWGSFGHPAGQRQGAGGRWNPPSCTTPTAGPGPPPGIWTNRSTTRPRCCPMAGARGGRRIPERKAQLYDPDTGSWTATADMRERHQNHDGDHITATLLRDDTVLVTGRGKSELYDPARGTWTATREQPKLDRSADAVRKRQRDALAGWQCAAGRARWRRAVRPDHRVLGADRVRALLQLRHIGHAAPRWHGPHGGRRHHGRRSRECSGAVRPGRRVGATRGGCPADPGPTPIPTPTPTADPDPDTVPTGGGSRPGGRTVLDRHRRQQELRARRRCSWPRTATTASASCAGP